MAIKYMRPTLENNIEQKKKMDDVNIGLLDDGAAAVILYMRILLYGCWCFIIWPPGIHGHRTAIRT